jgi:hypothetical protein
MHVPPTCLDAVVWFLVISLPVTVIWWMGSIWVWRRWHPGNPDTADRRLRRWVPAWCAWFLFLMSLLVCAGAR